MLTMSAAKRTPTFDELYLEIERLPPGLTGQILTPGVLTTMSRPGASHDYTLANCEHALARFDQRIGGHGWWIRQEFEVRFPGDRLAVPDLAGWRADQYPELPDDNPLRILPAWCAEVLSPSTASDVDVQRGYRRLCRSLHGEAGDVTDGDFHQVPSERSTSNGGSRTTSASRAVATSVGSRSIDS